MKQRRSEEKEDWPRIGTNIHESRPVFAAKSIREGPKPAEFKKCKETDNY
jgi:hypothetical protein